MKLFTFLIVLYLAIFVGMLVQLPTLLGLFEPIRLALQTPIVKF